MRAKVTTAKLAPIIRVSGESFLTEPCGFTDILHDAVLGGDGAAAKA